MKNKLKILSAIAVTGILFTSCYKKFDTNSYAPPFTINGFSSVSQIEPASLVGYWAFDGSLIDSVSGVAAENTGTSFTGGFKGKAMQGALNSYALATPSAAITGMHSFTLAYWVNSPAPSTGIIGMVNLAKTDGFWGNIDMFFENGSSNTNGKFRAHITNGPVDSWVTKDGIVNMHDTWTAVALTYDEATTTFKLYINASAVTTNVATGFGPINFTNVGKLVFGCVQFQTTPSQTTATGSQPWASYLTGQLDDVRIYNKALTGDEINAMIVLQGKGK